jgi:hypothetical protein
MARFLKTSDYLSIIQTVDLNQITENTPQNLYDSEVKAISRMRTKLVQRYMVDIELGVMAAFSAVTHYRTRDRVISGETITHVNDFDRWVKTTEYLSGEIVTDDDGYVYTALLDSQNIVLTNATYWGAMVNVLTTDADYWTVGDNRYPMFVELAMDMTLYNLHARINPRNIPELRIERNREALDQLDRWASGTDTAEVLNINTTDSEGFSIRYGNSLDKQDNFFK